MSPKYDIFNVFNTEIFRVIFGGGAKGEGGEVIVLAIQKLYTL